MNTWTDFQNQIPKLLEIEATFQGFAHTESLQNLLDETLPGIQGFDETMEREMHLRLIVMVESLPSPLYFWHFPFYPGDFPLLIQAMKAAGVRIPMEMGADVRDRFRNFLKTVPSKAISHMADNFQQPLHQQQARRMASLLAARRVEMVNLVSAN